MMKLLIFSLGLLISPPVQQHTNSSHGVGMEGYDPVAYFVDHKATTGLKDHQKKFEGVTYYFASLEHQHLFESNPARYLPQYGGWCAYAIGTSGDKVKVDPNTFKIVDGKLYLFYNFKGQNTLDYWNRDEPRLVTEANKQWADIIN